VRWFYNNCNWRNGGAGNFSVTGAIHGGAAGVEKHPCLSLHKLLVKLRELVARLGRNQLPSDAAAWERLYLQMVQHKDRVMRKKGNEAKPMPKIVNWPRVANN
jgi:hypothetical protein